MAEGVLGGNNRPLLKDLYDYVVNDVAHKWRELAVQLLRTDQENEIRIIESDNRHDSKGCCRCVLQKWLDTTTDATWDQLIAALRSPSVELHYTAARLIQYIKSIEGEANAHSRSDEKTCMLTTIEDIEVEFAIMTNKIKQALIDNEIDVNSLIEQLRTMSAVSNRKIPLLDEDVFFKIRSIDDFWRKLSTFWSVYDYDLLRFIIRLTQCGKAQNVLEEFLSRIDPEIIEDVDLVLHCRVDQKEGSLKPILRIKVNAEKCTYEVKSKVKKMVSKIYHLEEYSLWFKSIKEGCIELIFHISNAVMEYLLQCKITSSMLTEFSAYKIIGIHINDVDVLGSKANYSKIEEVHKLEEVLRKSSSSDLESGITLASEAIDRHEMDAKLYLLRAKLSFKLLDIKQFRGRVDERIKNCLGDCEQAIALVKRGNVMGDITKMKIEAIQLGYLCCVRLNNSQKRKKFEYQLSQLEIPMADPDQTKIELLCIAADHHVSSPSYDGDTIRFENKSGLANDLSFLAMMPEYCNVTFLVGESQQPMCGVKAILASRSRTFYKMFYGDTAKDQTKKTIKKGSRKGKLTKADFKENTYHVPEFEPAVFKELLQYTHCGMVVLEVHTLLGLTNAADHYGQEELKVACRGFLDKCMSNDTVVALLISAEKYIQYKATRIFIQKIFEYVDENAEEILGQKNFLVLPQHMVRLVLARDELQASETTKFVAAYRWVVRHCQDNPEVSYKEAFEPFVDVIEFENIPVPELMRLVKASQCVDDSVVLNALAYQAHHDPVDSGKYKVKQRSGGKRSTLLLPSMQRRSVSSAGFGNPHHFDSTTAVYMHKITHSTSTIKSQETLSDTKGSPERDTFGSTNSKDDGSDRILTSPSVASSIHCASSESLSSLSKHQATNQSNLSIRSAPHLEARTAMDRTEEL